MDSRGEPPAADRTGELSTFLKVSSGVASTLELEPLLGLILDQLRAVVSYSGAAIMSLEREILRILAYRGPIPQARVGALNFSLRTAPLNLEVIQRREPVIVPDVAGDTPLARAFQETAGYSLETDFSYVRCWMGIPLITKDQVIGMLSLDHDEPGHYSAQDAGLVQAFASQAAVAIENARLFAEAQRRAKEQSVLNELGQALTARLNVEQVLDEAYCGASSLLDTSSFYIALYDQDEDQVTFAIDVREGKLRKPYSTRKAGRGLTEYIIRGRTPLLLKDNPVERLQALGIEAIGPVAQSWLGVPLMVGDNVLGVMAVQSFAVPRAFDEHDRDLLTAIASPVAIALQNAHLFEETRDRAERLAVINRIARATSATLNLEELMETVYRETTAVFQADAFYIALYEEATGELDFRFRIDDGVRESQEKMPLGAGLTSIVVTEKKPLIIRNAEERDRLLPATQLFGTMRPALSWLGAPMLVGDQVIGIVSVQAYRPYAWEEEDERLLFTIADQVAVGIQNARLFTEVKQHAQELEALYHADEELYRYLNLDQVLEALMDVAVDILQADKSSLMVWDDQGEKLVVRVAHGFGAETIAQMTFAPGEGSVGRVAMTGEPAVVEDTHSDPTVAARITEPEGIRSFMHVPVKIEGQVFGVFNADYLQPQTFSDDQVRLFTSLAQRAGLAIQNAQLYEQAQELAVVQERQRLARDLHDAVTQTLFSASLIAEVLPRLWEISPEQGRQRLDELRELTRGALAEMRTLLLELRPSALAEADLGDLLEQLAESVTGRARVPVTVDLGAADSQSSGCPLPAEVKVALYRIAQEALNNVAKHAGECRAEVRLRCQPGQVELFIGDDGCGFDPEEASPDHLGLGIMQERAAQIGATLTVNSQAGCGTEVLVLWTTDHRIRGA
jgi:GAF domain-containing protein/anti-sigma regulatory factor (Ser/Thr protein kinase)